MERKGEQADRSQNRVGENPSRRLRRNDPACTRRRQKQLHPRSHTRKTPKHTQTRQAPPAGRTDEQYRTRIRRSQKVPRRPRAAHVPARKNQPTFCIDEIDHKIVDYLLHYKGATTPEIADYTKTNRWLILNRLRKIQKNSKKQHGKPIINYYAGEKSGKKKAWWI